MVSTIDQLVEALQHPKCDRLTYRICLTNLFRLVQASPELWQPEGLAASSFKQACYAEARSVALTELRQNITQLTAPQLMPWFNQKIWLVYQALFQNDGGQNDGGQNDGGQNDGDQSDG
jgi:hypothetical protein